MMRNVTPLAKANVRIFRNYARSKGYVKQAGSGSNSDTPEEWGVMADGTFQMRVRIDHRGANGQVELTMFRDGSGNYNVSKRTTGEIAPVNRVVAAQLGTLYGRSQSRAWQVFEDAGHPFRQNEAMINKLAQDLDANPNLELYLRENLVRRMAAWEGLKNLNIRDEHAISTVDNHILKTSKTPTQIASEIATSNGYHNWLGHHLVTYERNGFLIDRATIENRFATHLDVVERVESATQGGVVGGHNRNAFMQTLHNPTTNPTGRVVLDGTETSVGIPGISVVSYKTYATNANGTLISPLQFNGSPPGTKTKTLYDPGIVSTARMKELGYRGAVDAVENGRVFPSQQRMFIGYVDGVKIVGHYLESGGLKSVSSWWIEPL